MLKITQAKNWDGEIEYSLKIYDKDYGVLSSETAARVLDIIHDRHTLSFVKLGRKTVHMSELQPVVQQAIRIQRIEAVLKDN